MTKTNHILEERAAEMARPREKTALSGGTIEGLQFILAGEHYVMEAEYITGVVPLTELTQLPGLPDFYSGVSQIRGKLLGVLNTGRFLGVTTKGISNLNRVIVVHYGEIELGLLTDEVVGKIEINTRDIKPYSISDGGGSDEFIRGVTLDGVIVLESDIMLSSKKLIVDQGV